jgi:hypothetical protein
MTALGKEQPFDASVGFDIIDRRLNTFFGHFRARGVMGVKSL